MQGKVKQSLKHCFEGITVWQQRYSEETPFSYKIIYHNMKNPSDPCKFLLEDEGGGWHIFDGDRIFWVDYVFGIIAVGREFYYEGSKYLKVSKGYALRLSEISDGHIKSVGDAARYFEPSIKIYRTLEDSKEIKEEKDETTN